MLLELSLLLCAVEAVELEDEETVLLAEEATEEELELTELLLDELSWILLFSLIFSCLVTF
ncbi:hypothetical protein [Limosilactobacillus reuteri]|uniref:hypothetical protein n=1 Tax=Limosilactobacillus reuteri TaxID=1598 RepID=UPI001CBA778B|nr:hypothetical protein [Limosilactobacillus reuteri]